MLVAIRLRGGIRARKEIKDTLDMLRLNRVNTLSILPDNAYARGMIKKAEKFVAWGDLSDEIYKQLNGKNVVHLKPPRGGLKSVKQNYPKGDLGYRGEKINDLIRRMM